MNTIIPKSDIRQDEPPAKLPASHNVLAATCVSSIDMAHNSLLMAKDMAALLDLPIKNRLDEMAAKIYELSRDAHELKRQIEHGAFTEAATLMTEDERMMLHVARSRGNIFPKNDGEVAACELLVRRGLLVRGSGITTKRYIPVPSDVLKVLLRLTPAERLVLDFAKQRSAVIPSTPNDRLACDNLTRKGVFQLGADSMYSITITYKPWIYE